MTKKLAFTQWELDAIQYAERISSVLSVLGCFFVIATFTAFEIFRKPINRLVFFATWGNLATNVATLISRSGILAGVNSPLCQMQAFIIQMFMPADALWMLSMALNVYLTFFRRFCGDDLRALERYYLTINYGVPFIPALVFLFVKTESHGRIFGNATLWCWVTVKWNTFRIATFYGPVWVVLLSTMTIYILVGRVVFENQARFRELTATASKNQASMAARAPTAQPTVLKEGTDGKTTEVNVTSDACSSRHTSRAECKRVSYTVKVEASVPVLTPAEKKEQNSADRAAWAYLKCALLFFTAMIITWVPATINRVATLINPEMTSFGLNFTESLLLPLQGFFNAMIYIAISTDACNFLRAHCKRVFRSIFIIPFTRLVPGMIPLNDLPANPEGQQPSPRTRAGYPVAPSFGSPEMAPKQPRKAPAKEIQPEEIEEYERLHKKLNISPEPGSSAGNSSTH